MMKGIILAGGTGSRLAPMTKAVSKQLLPIYDKPMIYYPLSVLMLADIREVLIVTAQGQRQVFEHLLGTGSQFGLNIQFVEQCEPRGVAEAFLLGEEFLNGSNVCLVLGDNIFYGANFGPMLRKAKMNELGATIFTYLVNNPGDFGVIEFNEFDEPVAVLEKPTKTNSNHAITGLYFCDASVVDVAKTIKPSPRGELEITDVLKVYLESKHLIVETLGRGFAWLDTGTPEGLAKGSSFVEVVEQRQGFKVACLEEIAYKKGWITEDALIRLISNNEKSQYFQYIKTII